MDVLLDESYLTWLYSQIGSVKLRNRSKSHWSLARQLFKKEFVWFIPNDDNRVEDGRDLRFEFLEANGLTADEEWLSMGCSMLELLIGLARRLTFEMEGEPRVWFWHMIEMLDLFQYNDRVYDAQAEDKIDEALNRVIFRTYEADGRGGLFPLRRPPADQREVELWYQVSAYLLELTA
jgi:hypothetical protein